MRGIGVSYARSIFRRARCAQDLALVAAAMDDLTAKTKASSPWTLKSFSHHPVYFIGDSLY
jgi:hypothetical protein